MPLSYFNPPQLHSVGNPRGFLKFKFIFLHVFDLFITLFKAGSTSAPWFRFFLLGRGVGLGLGAGNVTAGSTPMGAGIKEKFALVTKKSDALPAGLSSRLPKWSRRRAASAFPS